jgi:hypothetical protein
MAVAERPAQRRDFPEELAATEPHALVGRHAVVPGMRCRSTNNTVCAMTKLGESQS